MDNLEVFGGSSIDRWVTGRLEMARENQRWKKIFGYMIQYYKVMQEWCRPIFVDHQADAEILEQGGWCGLNRPDMIRTDSQLYDEYHILLFINTRMGIYCNTNDYYLYFG